MSLVNPYASPNPHPGDDPPLVAQLAVDGEAMTVEFEQTFAELLAFQYYLLAQMGFVAPARRAWTSLALLGLLMAGGLILILLNEEFHDFAIIPTLGLVIVALIAAFWPFTVWYYRWYVGRVLRNLTARGRNLNLTGPRRVVITPEFLVFSSPAFQTAYRWTCLENTLVQEDNLFILISSVEALVIPRRAFNSDVHFREFAAKATEYHAVHLRGEQFPINPAPSSATNAAG